MQLKNVYVRAENGTENRAHEERNEKMNRTSTSPESMCIR